MSASSVAPYAQALCRVALANIGQEYPNHPGHVLNSAADLQSPRVLHPLFYGSYDWHSCVHMHWLLVRLLCDFPSLPQMQLVWQTLDAHFTEANVAAEIAFLQQPSRATFERPYGWAWLLKLQTALIEGAKADPRIARWRDAMQPLADLIGERYLHFLPLAHYPIRAGTHGNSAFGLLFALDYAECIQHFALRKLICDKANAWFGRDRRYPAAYEPSGDDFLSGGLMEAALMLRVVDGCSYADWWDVFCPPPHDLAAWLRPVTAGDRSDPKLAHLDGLNLTRAWCWKMIVPQLPDWLQTPVHEAIAGHLAASLPHAADGDYAGTHWLASFAFLALAQH